MVLSFYDVNELDTSDRLHGSRGSYIRHSTGIELTISFPEERTILPKVNFFRSWDLKALCSAIQSQISQNIFPISSCTHSLVLISARSSEDTRC